METTHQGQEARVARARTGIAPDLLVLYGLITAGVSVLTSGRRLSSVLAGDLTDPDSYMRLVRLRAIVQQGQLVDAVANDGSGHGTVLHWSHLLDSLLCLLALPLRLFTDDTHSLYWAGVALGPLGMAALGMAVIWAVAPLAQGRWLWSTAILLAVSPPVIGYGMTGIVHRHVLLAAIVAMMAGWAMRAALDARARGAGLALGAWAGIGIWLTPESMPFVLMAFGLVWFAWLAKPGFSHYQPGRLPNRGRITRDAGVSFLAVVAATFLIDPPLEQPWHGFTDRLSVTYLALAGVTMLIGVIAMAIDRRGLSPTQRATTATLAATALLGLWIACFPGLLRGAESVVDPAQARAMLDVIAEMKPVRSTADLISMLLNGALATVFVGWCAVTRRSMLLGYAALCGVVLVGLGQSHFRFTIYPAIYAAGVLPICFGCLQARVAQWRDGWQAAARLALFCVVFVSGDVTMLGTLLMPGSADAATDADCSVRTLAPRLGPYAGQVVLSDVDDVPELLYRTGVLTVGSLYHRNAAGFMRLRDAWNSAPSDIVPPAVRATEAGYVLACRHDTRPQAGMAEAPLQTMLAKGAVPAWLDLVFDDRASGFMLYRVRP